MNQKNEALIAEIIPKILSTPFDQLTLFLALYMFLAYEHIHKNKWSKE